MDLAKVDDLVECVGLEAQVHLITNPLSFSLSLFVFYFS
jgi:hypothetical protein